MNKEQLLARQKELKDKIERLNTKQHCIKVFINSVYGFFGNKHASFGDDDIAASITLTGQAVIKQAAELSAEFINKNYNLNVTASDVRTYGDTDSCAFDTIINTKDKDEQIGKLWDECSSLIDRTNKGHELKTPLELFCKSFDSTKKKVVWKKINKISRHKVTKDRWEIVVNGKKVIVTGDHNCMVYRDGKLIEVSPKNIKKDDKMVVVIQ